MLLTRLPAGWLARGGAPDNARAVWAYPVVGLLVGAIGAAVQALVARPPLVAALLALAAMAVATGALHEDGLADTADGLGGGTRTKKLEIMRDSRIGGFGALALVLVTALRAAALAALLRPGPALMVAACLGRGAIVLVVRLLPPARADGLAAGLRGPGRAACVAFAIAVSVAAALLPWRSTLLALAGATAVALGMAALARRQLGGHTGDVLGAASVLAETAVLILLARSA